MDFRLSIPALRGHGNSCRALIALAFVAVVAGWCLPQAKAETSLQDQQRWPKCEGSSTTQKVSFVHISDMHANYNPGSDGISPASRVRGYYERVKRENPYTVFTNSGDDYEKGSIAEQLSRGRTTREVVQALGYDVRTLGNHDFAWGIAEFLMFANDPRAVVLSTNTKINRQIDGPLRDLPAGFTDFSVLKVGCLKIGFFGLTARPYSHDGQQHNGPVYPDVPALEMDFDFIGIASRVIARYRQEVDVLVLVSHMGITDDIAVAEQTTGIDLILGGHSHTTLDKPLQVQDTTIVHVGAHAEQIGRYDLTYDLHNRRIAESSLQLIGNTGENLPVAEGLNQAVAHILSPYQRQLNETVAEVDNSQSPQAMALIAARAAVQALRIDAAFIGVGSVWQEWRSGFLTRQDILNAFQVEREPVGTPGTSSLYLLEVLGADLLRARMAMQDAAYWGPSEIDPRLFYSVAMQKPQALDQERFFSRVIAILPPQPLTELWEAVVMLAGDLHARNLSLDEGSGEQNNRELVATLAGQKKYPTL